MHEKDAIPVAGFEDEGLHGENLKQFVEAETNVWVTTMKKTRTSVLQRTGVYQQSKGISFPDALDENVAWLSPRFQPCKTLSRESI